MGERCIKINKNTTDRFIAPTIFSAPMTFRRLKHIAYPFNKLEYKNKT